MPAHNGQHGQWHTKTHREKWPVGHSPQQDSDTFGNIAPMTDSNTPSNTLSNTLPQTLCEFLQHAGAHVHFYDVGRRVVEIPADDMLAIERQQKPYSLPFLRSASLGVLFYYEDADGKNTDQQIWFLKFGLDEQGLLSQSARDDFLRRMIEQLAEQTLANQNAESTSETAQTPPAMPEDNPHGFTPRDERMACFHAKIAKKLDQAPSQFYPHAMDYFTGKPGFDQWNFVGLQGIADVVARLDEDHNLATVIAAIPQLPSTPFAALCSCLENETIDADLSTVLGIRLEHALQENDNATVAAAIRGLSHGSDQTTLNKAIHSTLEHDAGLDVEVLATIAGRAWHCLERADTRRAFLHCLSRCTAGQRAFDHIMADLMFIPGLRKPLLDELRNLRDAGDCLPQQTEIIGYFFNALHTR